MRIATWNVNSVRARRDRLLAWLPKHAPDVLCLQELKVTDDAFPRAEVEALGYHVETFGQKAYNGVAILSRLPLEDVARSLDDGVEDPQARLIAATVSGVRVLSAYFPNGGAVGDPKWTYKLEWMRRLATHLRARYLGKTELVLAGDFNVAPSDLDVAFPPMWTGSVLTHPDARAALASIAELGLVDVFRALDPEARVYSWWDYQMLAFPKGNGLRIDHVFATRDLATRATTCTVDRNERKGKLPSDHAPVIAAFA